MGNYFTVLEDKDRLWSVSEENYARENLFGLTIMTDETLKTMIKESETAGKKSSEVAHAFVPQINEDPCKKKEQKPL